MNDKNILLVEDEPGLVLTLTDRLEDEGFTVTSCQDGESGLNMALKEDFDLIILDVMLPKKSGLDVCQELRKQDTEAPILMLTARGQVVDKVVGLRLGADDYVTKPFEVSELLARIDALIRRSKMYESKKKTHETFAFNDVEIDFRKAEVTRAGDRVELSAKEFQLLKYFVENTGATLSRDELLNEVWGYDALPSTRTIDVHVAWLRQKLEPTARRPKYILTVHGLGYKFVGEEGSSAE